MRIAALMPWIRVESAGSFIFIHSGLRSRASRSVATFLTGITVLDDADAVCMGHGREPVRDEEDGLSAGELREGRLDLRLVVRVRKGGRLVEDQDGRVLEHGAGDGDALPLAAGASSLNFFTTINKRRNPFLFVLLVKT